MQCYNNLRRISQVKTTGISMNVAKVALILILLLLMVVIFFALTGMDVRNPMAAIERIIGWTIELNRSLNRMMREFMFSISTSIREWFQ